MEIRIPILGPEVLTRFTCDRSVNPVQVPPGFACGLAPLAEWSLGGADAEGAAGYGSRIRGSFEEDSQRARGL